jgi:hypothetical protein
MDGETNKIRDSTDPPFELLLVASRVAASAACRKMGDIWMWIPQSMHKISRVTEIEICTAELRKKENNCRQVSAATPWGTIKS